ncbi:cbb3-type cytochrome oxidase maturation protein [Alteromonadaceae bacterium 2753L.S.0a.02]|nr:cbb3-type cytochrome oxidase maturation protein [Alteromonadaceae bacterium 2753L.S.0a.02]
MESLLILIPIAIVFVIIAIAIFFWAVKSGQYDDLETEARRILFDEDLPEKKAPVNNPKTLNKASKKTKNNNES